MDKENVTKNETTKIIETPIISVEDVDIVHINSPFTPIKKGENSFYLEEPEIKDVISPGLSTYDNDRRESFLDLSDLKNSSFEGSFDSSFEDHPDILKFFKKD